jgi:hypothetical protein
MFTFDNYPAHNIGHRFNYRLLLEKSRSDRVVGPVVGGRGYRNRQARRASRRSPSCTSILSSVW